MKERIAKKLSQNLSVNKLEIIDKSHLHRGHIGAGSGTETHFDLVIAAKEFQGLNRLEANRKINKILAEEFNNGLHALSVKIEN